MEPKLGDMMKVDPSLTGLPEWVKGSVIDIEHNPFMGLVISIKDSSGRIFFGQAKYFKSVDQDLKTAFKGDWGEGMSAKEYAEELRSSRTFTRTVDTW